MLLSNLLCQAFMTHFNSSDVHKSSYVISVLQIHQWTYMYPRLGPSRSLEQQVAMRYPSALKILSEYFSVVIHVGKILLVYKKATFSRKL